MEVDEFANEDDRELKVHAILSRVDKKSDESLSSMCMPTDRDASRSRCETTGLVSWVSRNTSLHVAFQPPPIAMIILLLSARQARRLRCHRVHRRCFATRQPSTGRVKRALERLYDGILLTSEKPASKSYTLERLSVLYTICQSVARNLDGLGALDDIGRFVIPLGPR